MADYTPDRARIAGNEWVPLKYQVYPLDRSQEIGTTFDLETSSTVVSGRVYVDDSVQPGRGGTGTTIHVYPQDDLSEAGPIRQVIIPVDGALSSGTGTVDSESGSFVTDLALASDFNSVQFTVLGGEDAQLNMYFDVQGYMSELAGKRIVKVEFLYSIFSLPAALPGLSPGGVEEVTQFSATFVATIRDSDLDGFVYSANEQVFVPAFNNSSAVQAIDMGNINPIWDKPSNGTFIYPWTYETLANFDTSAAAAVRTAVTMAIFGNFDIPVVSVSFRLGYAALRISYCEEKRVLFGALSDGVSVGANGLILRPPTLASLGTTLNPGRYAVTTSRYTIGDQDSVDPINLNSIIEKYPMVKQIGVMLPIVDDLDAVATAETTSTIVQLSLHTSAATVEEVHPYGKQIAAPVWGSSTNPAFQGILSEGAGPAYPFARFYARHLPGTTAPLTLRHATFTTIAASIDVETFDALDEIVDGWREVNLEFSSPTPSFGAVGVLETFEWTSAATVGTQWQVMSAAAPAITGLPFPTQLTSAHDLDEATYGGDEAVLTWNGVADSTADATLMLATAGPAVSGLALETSTIEVTGIGLYCGAFSPECIPTGITYHALTWTPLDATSMPATGFGFYELQRSDEFTDWMTILEASSPLVSGFSDLEPRVAVQSSYRIRFVDRLGFYGPWSSSVTNELTFPGVTGTNAGNGVLIFTANERQDGSGALAYAMQWDRDVREDFDFLEAATVQYQRMYGRDFQVAFHGTERGGERFQRTLLVQAAAVPTGLIRDGFTSLRDLAWADLSYVCVRDELGDRWLASVQVPSGDVRRRRTLYMAEVTITEVTDTPSVVALPAEGDCTEAIWDESPGWDYACWGE